MAKTLKDLRFSIIAGKDTKESANSLCPFLELVCYYFNESRNTTPAIQTAAKC